MAESAETAGIPAAKVVDMAMGTANAPPVEPEANPAGDAPAQEEGKPAAEGAPPPAPAEPTAPEVSKLERARAAARAKSEENRRRQIAQAEAHRREQDRLAAHQALAAERERAAALQAQLDAIRDPMSALAYLEKVGLPAKTLAEKAVEQSTPEARLRAELESKVEERLKAVQTEYQDRIQRLEAERAAQQHRAAYAAAQHEFLRQASDEAAYPSVAKITALGDEWKASVLGEATRVLEEAFQRTGQSYTDAEVLAYLEQKYSKLMPLSGKAGAPKSNGTKEADGAGAQVTQAAGGSRTLTNKDAQVKGTIPPDFDNLSKEEQNKALAALYRALRKP